MFRVGSGLVRALWLLRCSYSAEARREFQVYRENTSKFEQILDLVGALFGFVMLGVLAVGVYECVIVFYHLATTGQATP